jgi:hypothetical protein
MGGTPEEGFVASFSLEPSSLAWLVGFASKKSGRAKKGSGYCDTDPMRPILLVRHRPLLDGVYSLYVVHFQCVASPLP